MALPKLLRIVPLAFAVAACGTDQTGAPTAPQAGAGGQPTYGAVQTVPVSASEHDRFLSAAFDSTNRLYAAGFVGAGADQQMAVTRFNADGSLDAGFGANGTAAVNVATGGKAVELARGVVVQGDGKVVIAGPVEHDPAASGDAAKDTDIALARFDQSGRLDAGFGTAGVVRLDLSTGVAEGTAFRGDTAWGLVKVAGEKLLVVGAQVATGRTDADFAVVRLNADGTKGPVVPELVPWLSERAQAGTHDAAIFFTYLYWTTWAGLPAVAGKMPTVLHPTAHDEPSLSLSLFDATFRLPDAIAYSTEEERALVRRRFRVDPPSAVLGIGFDLDLPGDAGAFRDSHGLGDAPYIVVVGRVDAAKGSDELFDFFLAYKERHPGPLKLVVVGEPVQTPPGHPDLVVTGFVDEASKRGAVEGATLLVQPSYFESFSMVLAEAWLQRRPALVQGHCDTLAGHARRSGGAIAYRGYAEFEAALELVIGDPGLATRLAEAGRRYIASTYGWDVVLGRYEELLTEVRSRARSAGR